MSSVTKSIRISLALGALSAVVLLISNFALVDIQHGNGHGLEWGIMHFSYAVFILFHVAAIVTFARVLRRVDKQTKE